MDTPNYKESIATGGLKWTRANQVIIYNPLNGGPRITFAEEEIRTIDGVPEPKYVGNSLAVNFDPANPLHVAAYSAINEVYIEARTLRDAV